jgi:hypothetical protein
MSTPSCETCGAPLVFARSVRRNGRVIKPKKAKFFVWCPNRCKH